MGFLSVLKRRRTAVVLLTLPLLILTAWLVASQLPTFLAPSAAWFGEQAGACEVAGLLRALDGSRTSGSPPISAADAASQASVAAQAQFNLTPTVSGDPLLVSLEINNIDRTVWLVMLTLSPAPQVVETGVQVTGMSAVALIDANSGEVLRLYANANTPLSSTCAFNWRDWAAAAVRSLPALLLGGYVGGLVVLGVGWSGWRVIRRKRRVAGASAGG